ncbi:hypothetical protein ACSVHC_15515 [Arthrobacter sp. KNU-44]|uniref:hypothetical protein n=1 Tax=Arthrobacter sp. KNU-44 TaxID=3450744 RepID=UPI003F433DBF
MVEHEADFDVQKPKRTASRWLAVLAGLAAVTAPGVFIKLGMVPVAEGVLILAPALFYTSLLASASTGTTCARWWYRAVGFIMWVPYYFLFAKAMPDQFVSIVLSLVGLAYCLLVDAFTPSCTGEPVSWKKILKEPDFTLIKMTGTVPTGLTVNQKPGHLSGIPATAGSFTLSIWDAKAECIRDVTYNVTVAGP